MTSRLLRGKWKEKYPFWERKFMTVIFTEAIFVNNKVNFPNHFID